MWVFEAEAEAVGFDSRFQISWWDSYKQNTFWWKRENGSGGSGPDKRTASKTLALCDHQRVPIGRLIIDWILIRRNLFGRKLIFFFKLKLERTRVMTST